VSRDRLFASTAARGSDFQFDEEVAAVFDDMLVRSVPFYNEQQAIIQEAALVIRPAERQPGPTV
jgi:tRNA (cmo5U34)-methyltransferase